MHDYDQVITGVQAFLELLFLSPGRVYTMRVKRCDLSPKEKGGWDLVIWPCREVFSNKAFYEVPADANSVRYCMDTLELFLKQKQGIQSTLSVSKAVGEKEITKNQRWEEFKKLWNLIF